MWSLPNPIETRNADYLPRFQALCEKFGFKPTWLTNYEMARSRPFQDLARDVLKRGTGEVGMHLHAWNNPPLIPLTDDDHRHQPFLREYPAEQVRAKVAFLTAYLEDAFGVKMTSHRAGRWALDETYARILVDHGYLTDCSVTPGVSWKEYLGNPAGAGGADYTGFPEAAYFLDLDDIRRPGRSPLLELPMTIREKRGPLGHWVSDRSRPRFARLRGVGRFFSRTHWLRPVGGNLPAMLDLVAAAERERRPYLEFMLHSSELMPGGSPSFADQAGIEGLYRDLEILFAAIARGFQGSTLHEYRQTFTGAAA